MSDSRTLPSQFARLIPYNEAAKTAFHLLASRVQQQPDQAWLLHAKRYLFLLDNGEYGKATQERRWTGYYQLDFKIPPKATQIGWVIGSAKSEQEDEMADILLTVTNETGYFPRLAHLFHKYDSGAFMIKAHDHQVVIIDGTDELHNNQRLLHRCNSTLEFGNLKYGLEFQDMPELDFPAVLASYNITHSLDYRGYPASILATPSKLDWVNEKYVIKNRVGDGQSCAVYAAQARHTGKAVAIKIMKRTDQRAAIIEADKALAGVIKHVSVNFLPGYERSQALTDSLEPRICGLIEVFEAVMKLPNRSSKDLVVGDIHYIYSPLASWTVRTALDTWDGVPCVTLLDQYLEGLEFLHSKGVMHRDIKPANLIVVSLDPLEGQIIDFGHALRELQSSEGDVGTPGYQAPEVAAITGNYDIHSQYDETIDIFSLGVSIALLIRRTPITWGYIIERQDVTRLKNDIAIAGVSRSIVGVIMSFMDWDPLHGPSSSEARKVLATLMAAPQKHQTQVGDLGGTGAESSGGELHRRIARQAIRRGGGQNEAGRGRGRGTRGFLRDVWEAMEEHAEEPVEDGADEQSRISSSYVLVVI